MPDTAKIRELNDAFRTTFIGGDVMVTPGVADRSERSAILIHVQEFSDFGPSNDPHGEHDFGSFQIADERIFWKIDYYDPDRHGGSPDPADPAVTRRVLTILLAEEY
jgi:hypothetical protein